MKRKKLYIIKMLILCVMLSACGTAGAEASESSDAEESADAATLTLSDGTEISLTKTDSYAIAGTYVCASDGSIWTFGGDDLAVAYYDEEDGSLSSDVCELTFYMTQANDDGESYLCLDVYNKLSEVSTYWYITNLVDDDENVIGLLLQQPGDETEVYVQLWTDEYYAALSESGDAK